MRDEYDFTNAVKNPYGKDGEGKTTITIRLDTKTIRYFKTLAGESGLPYQVLINSYLAECVQKELKPKTVWS